LTPNFAFLFAANIAVGWYGIREMMPANPAMLKIA
jgi:hypothetical protein